MEECGGGGGGALVLQFHGGGLQAYSILTEWGGTLHECGGEEKGPINKMTP